MSKLKNIIKNEDARHMLKYAWSSFKYVFPITALLVIAAALLLLITGNFTEVFISMNLKYDAAPIVGAFWLFFIIAAGCVVYGIVLSMRQYHRPGGRGMTQKIYPHGTSYHSLHDTLTEEHNKKGKETQK